ncbi:hypothetical protein [Methylocapsa acidiphila]|uniref:hypothetical protein n=1 Tax=Methylocapsa acidiphila TaxID=133552 RepID=UPI00041F40A0|nr:hypothetical protein [Methylocapsa acidiphila]
MTTGRAARAFLPSLAILAGFCFNPAQAADLNGSYGGYAPPPPPPPPQFLVGVDARCRIVPMPQLDLVGDTARFRPTAVCQSRGVYSDSLEFPAAPVFYPTYPY